MNTRPPPPFPSPPSQNKKTKTKNKNKNKKTPKKQTKKQTKTNKTKQNKTKKKKRRRRRRRKTRRYLFKNSSSTLVGRFTCRTHSCQEGDRWGGEISPSVYCHTECQYTDRLILCLLCTLGKKIKSILSVFYNLVLFFFQFIR